MKPTQTLFALATLVLFSAGVSAAEIGQRAPEWRYIQGTDEKLHSLSDCKDAKLIVVAFMCNKCPCVRGYESRFNRFAEHYGTKGVKFVGFNSVIGPIENLPTMKQRATSGQYKFDYLRDANQQIGRAFGATSTPHVFIIDSNRNVVYTGAFDDNRTESLVKNHYVVDAVEALLAGKSVPVARTRQFGCAINYQQ